MKPKILVIEDNEQNLYLVTFILEKNGFDVVAARDGREGIDIACSVTPALTRYARIPGKPKWPAACALSRR